MDQEQDQPKRKSKKRRIIHWYPHPDKSGESEGAPGSRTWLWISLCMVGGLLGLAALLLWPESGGNSTADPKAPAETETPVSAAHEPVLEFVTDSQLARAEAAVREGLDQIRRQTDESPLLLENLIAIEDLEKKGKTLKAQSKLTESFTQFLNASNRIETFRGMLAEKTRVEQAENRFSEAYQNLAYLQRAEPQDYQTAARHGVAGRNLARDGSYAPAAQEFEAGLEALRGAQQKVDRILDAKELAGTRALAEGDKDLALQRFQEILDINPNHASAKIKLQRAQTIDRVHQLVTSGEAKETQGQLEGALQDYQAALELDSRSVKAQQGKHRVLGAIRDKKFQGLMAEAATLEARHQYDAAIVKLQEAGKVNPLSHGQEVKAALERTEKNKRKHLILVGLQAAREHEQRHEWDQALEKYGWVLDFEPNNKQALEGVEYVGKISRGSAKYNYLIREALDFAEQGQFQKAIKSYEEAMANKPSNVPKSSKVLELEKTLNAQAQAIEVVLKSDNRTNVRIKGGAILGRFREKKQNFFPGNYELIGMRNRYDPVRVFIEVRRGITLEPVEVECTVKSK